MKRNLSCCTWALSGPDNEVLHQLANIGCQNIDIRPFDFATAVSRALIKSMGFNISCLSLSFSIPEGTALDAFDEASRHAAQKSLLDGIEVGAELGAPMAYVVPGKDSSTQALDYYAESLCLLADRAATHGIRFGIEHFPDTALPTIADTLAFLRKVDHPNLYLLLDIGHAQMSNEDVPSAIADAGDRLGYVHLDDNDGVGDLHWALLDGLLTVESLCNTFSALDAHGYARGISLELHPLLPDPLDALQRSWDVVTNAWGS